MKSKKSTIVATYVLFIIGVLLIILPLYMTVITAFKTTAENAESFFTLPKKFRLDNFKTVLEGGKYFKAFLNSFYITIAVLIGNTIIMPAMSYAIARSMDTKSIYKWIYYFILLGIFIPFEVKMIPLVKQLSVFNMLNPTGLIIVYISSSTCEATFLYVGYIKSLPSDYEEAASIDGATTLRTYLSIILPLIRPMIVTVIIRNALWIWNDFMLPLVTLNRSWEHWTLTLFQYNFRTEYSIDYSLTFATLCMSMLPILVFYVFMQKNIIGGLTAGGIKG